MVNLLRRKVVRATGFSTIGVNFSNTPEKCGCESESENKKSELLALTHTLALFVVPSGLEPELF
jgi:hypothetical protein